MYRITAQFFKKEYYTDESTPRLLNSPTEKLEAAMTCGIKEKQTITEQKTFEAKTKRAADEQMRTYLDSQPRNIDYTFLEDGWHK